MYCVSGWKCVSEEGPGSWQWGLPSPLAGIQCESVSCYVMSWGKRAHLHCSLASKVREGSKKTLCSASGFYWLILKANEIQEQGAHDENNFWSLS